MNYQKKKKMRKKSLLRVGPKGPTNNLENIAQWLIEIRAIKYLKSSNEYLNMKVVLLKVLNLVFFLMKSINKLLLVWCTNPVVSFKKQIKLNLFVFLSNCINYI